jgi:hypothetical protein
MLSTEVVTREIGLLSTIALGIGCYIAVAIYFLNRESRQEKSSVKAQESRWAAEDLWHDHNPVEKRLPLSPVFHYGSVYSISAFSSACLLNRALPTPATQQTPKLCVSRSGTDTEKLLHPLIKKIESRLRRSEIRPRPRLRIEREILPFPLFSSTRADQELTAYVVEFLDASIDLSISCDTQVHFMLSCQADGIRIAALWAKNQLISDATGQIELLNDMRLTFQGDTIRWDYQIFFCPQVSSEISDQTVSLLRDSA